MFKKVYSLIKILRKLSISGAVDVIDEIKKLPIGLKFIFYVFSLGQTNKTELVNKSSGENYALHYKAWVQLL